MKREDHRKRAKEDFKKILPYLNQLIEKVKLTDKPKKYSFNNEDFIIRLNFDVIEMSLAIEKSIFPTIAYRQVGKTNADLLHYRVSSDFSSAIYRSLFK